MMCENSTSPGTQRTLVHFHHNLSYFSYFSIFLSTTKKKQCTLHRYIFIKSSSLGTKKRLKFDIFTYLGDIFCLIYQVSRQTKIWKNKTKSLHSGKKKNFEGTFRVSQDRISRLIWQNSKFLEILKTTVVKQFGLF